MHICTLSGNIQYSWKQHCFPAQRGVLLLYGIIFLQGSPKNRMANIQISELCDYIEQGQINWA